MASLGRLQPETRPGDGVRARRKPAFTNPRNKFYLDTAGIHKPGANATLYSYVSHQRQRNSSEKVCAAKIINDLDCNGAVITGCGGSQGSLWKHSLLPVICAQSRREHSKHNRKRNERETAGSFSGSVESKSKQLSRALTWSTCGNSSHVMKLHRPLNLIPKPQPQIQHLFAVHCSTLKRLR